MNQKLLQIFRFVKPWLTAIALLLVLRYTGLLGGLSVLTQTAAIHSGLMDASPSPDDAAPSFNYKFTIRDLEGKEVDVSTFRGKVIFLNLWATWCGPCRAEMPSIQELYEKSDRDKVVFIMLSLDTGENHDKVVRYIKDKGFTFPVYVPHSSLPNQLRVSTIPSTFVVDTEGKVKMKKTGMANYDTEEFREFLKTLQQVE